MTRADQKFLDECLKVKRERDWHSPAPPRSPAWSLPTPSPAHKGEEALHRPRFGGPPVRLELHPLNSDSWTKTLHSPSGPRWRSEHGGEDGLFLAVAELMRATAAVQAQQSEVAERVNKLELKMPSSSKVASEFQRMWYSDHPYPRLARCAHTRPARLLPVTTSQCVLYNPGPA